MTIFDGQVGHEGQKGQCCLNFDFFDFYDLCDF
jgi:hypothetical protein